MNDIFGRGQGYDLLNDEYTSISDNLKSVSAENALLKSGVIATRWDDVKAILGSKGLDITAENIEAEIGTHPEWRNNGGSNNSGSNDAMSTGTGNEFSPEMGEQFADNAIKAKMPEPEKTGTIRKFGSNVPESKEGLEEADLRKLFGV